MYDLLKGLTVVEAAAFIAGPSCGLYLGQFGAEVIRIDTIGGGPDFRRWPLAENGESLYWEGLNKAKQSVVIDLAKPEGRELAQRLAAAPGEDRGLFVTNFPATGFLAYHRLKAPWLEWRLSRLGRPGSSPAPLLVPVLSPQAAAAPTDQASLK